MPTYRPALPTVRSFADAFAARYGDREVPLADALDEETGIAFATNPPDTSTLIALLNFRFIYPSERHCVPRWLMDELLERLHDQKDIKGPGRRVCRGRIFSPRDYAIDVDQWGFSDAVGNLEEQYGE